MHNTVHPGFSHGCVERKSCNLGYILQISAHRCPASSDECCSQQLIRTFQKGKHAQAWTSNPSVSDQSMQYPSPASTLEEDSNMCSI